MPLRLRTKRPAGGAGDSNFIVAILVDGENVITVWSALRGFLYSSAARYGLDKDGGHVDVTATSGSSKGI